LDNHSVAPGSGVQGGVQKSGSGYCKVLVLCKSEPGVVGRGYRNLLS
jgi:hypothetical protein